MITVEDLTKTYGSKTVVDHLSFQVQPGVVTGFLGPNGAGKSTTMRMMLGLECPNAGVVRYDGTEYAALPRPLTTVGAVLDAGWVHPGRSARNHLRWLAASNHLSDSRVDEVLNVVGLTSVANKKAGSFSLGMRQRLGLAATLLGDPQYLLLDEPVNGLDPEGIHWMRRIIRRLASEGRGVLVSSHLLSEMSQTADHLVVIGTGRLISNSTVDEFVGNGEAAPVRVRVADPQRLEQELRSRGAGGVEVVQDARGPFLRVHGLTGVQIGETALAAQTAVFELVEERASLEDVFMRRTAGSVEYHALSDEASKENVR